MAPLLGAPRARGPRFIEPPEPPVPTPLHLPDYRFVCIPQRCTGSTENKCSRCVLVDLNFLNQLSLLLSVLKSAIFQSIIITGTLNTCKGSKNVNFDQYIGISLKWRKIRPKELLIGIGRLLYRTICLYVTSGDVGWPLKVVSANGNLFMASTLCPAQVDSTREWTWYMYHSCLVLFGLM